MNIVYTAWHGSVNGVDHCSLMAGGSFCHVDGVVCNFSTSQTAMWFLFTIFFLYINTT